MQEALERDLHRINAGEVGQQLDPFEFLSPPHQHAALPPPLPADLTRILIMELFEEPHELAATVREFMHRFASKHTAGGTELRCAGVRQFMNELSQRIEQQFWPRLELVIKDPSSPAATDEDIAMLQSVIEEALQTVVVSIEAWSALHTIYGFVIGIASTGRADHCI